MTKGKRPSSKAWLREHVSDAYVKQAHQQGRRSRGYFKLKALNDRDALITVGSRVVDLGASPGGWSEYASKMVGTKGSVTALDRLVMAPLAGVTFIHGDFTDSAILQTLHTVLAGTVPTLVMSDMAPNISGNPSVDVPRAMALSELALEFARQQLTIGGHFVVKLFQGEGFDAYLHQCRTIFDKVYIRKPDASRSRSREVYLVAKSFKLV